MASTQDMRNAWSPQCDVVGNTTIDFGDAGAHITVDELTVPIWRAVEAIFARHRYTIRKADTGAYNCRIITGGSGYSLHAYGIAVDVNWSTNPYGPTLKTDMPPDAIREIEALRVEGQQVVRWGGRYSGNKDAMHFEVVVPPSLAVKFTYEGDDWLMGANAQDVVDAINEAKASNIRQHQKDRRQAAAIAKAEGRADAKAVDRIVDAIEAGDD